MSEFKVGDEVRVVGQFVIEAIDDTSFGPQYVHTDADGQSWGFIPGSNTKSMTLASEPLADDPTLGVMAQRFYEGCGIPLPHTSKPDIVAGLRAALAVIQ